MKDESDYLDCLTELWCILGPVFGQIFSGLQEMWRGGGDTHETTSKINRVPEEKRLGEQYKTSSLVSVSLLFLWRLWLIDATTQQWWKVHLLMYSTVLRYFYGPMSRSLSMKQLFIFLVSVKRHKVTRDRKMRKWRSTTITHKTTLQQND